MDNKFKLKDLPSLLKWTYKEWMADDAFGKAAAVAYYAVFAMPGFLIMVIFIAGFFISEESATGAITEQVSEMMGEKTANNIESILSKSQIDEQKFGAAAISVISLIFGATGVFFQLQKSLNNIWEVQKKPNSGIKQMLLDRIASMGIIIVVGFLLLLSLSLSAMISVLANWLSETFSTNMMIITVLGEFLLSLFIVTLLFAAIFKVLPDVIIHWKSVWIGALITALLFSLGKWLIAYYLSETNPESSFGASGALILILLWVSYSCLILFFGAEFTQVFTYKYGYEIRPSEYAEYTPEYILKHTDEYQTID
ncbi:YihY/virulence factor BrkB family protein [Marinigracilibium pacificum]|uniref:YihY/virulence factor BrkB family protein n=1 Tax=Marinigracilibium pacificum TaxID=2729599 RepID=A0A848IUE6_9BACT|nr:YihY/virulence factor BrkB family protein [Marinigracilibium pacificum]NMM47336.1 YihY/virulence factor BrkB family protein [Marinigracilibium pacificum]